MFGERFGFVIEPGWMDFPDVLPRLIDGALRAGPDPWGWHLVFDERDVLIGNCGWKGAPVDGTAELGYGIAHSRRGRGAATAVVRELLRRGRAAGLLVATARTRPEESASTTVLRRCGFEFAGEVMTEDLGRVWWWELALGR